MRSIRLPEKLSTNVNISIRNFSHTPRLILRPSVTSSGKIFKNSRTQSPALLPKADPTVAKTSFQDSIWIAKLAKHTHS